jgi:hypothetical protein
MKLRTAKKAHDLINKRNEIRSGVDRLKNVIWDNCYGIDFDAKHIAAILLYYEELLDEDLGKVDKQIERLK